MSAAANTDVVQPDSFAFTPENLEKVKKIVAKYPEGRQGSAVMPLLDLAQRQHGWLPRAAMDEIARLLDMAPIRVYEVATFYTMYNLQPVGKYLIQVCRTTPCWLRGSDNLTDYLKQRLGVGMKEVTKDGLFSIMEVECLGACCNAPMVQINDDFYEDLTPETLGKVLDELAAGRKPQTGPQNGRRASMAEGGPTTLKDIPISYDISRDLTGGK
ncbi:NADH dehydrogenase subunit E [Dongia mobilis]|uniref:NADH dehydrogenase subunit E n=1 Tax=Dongia mobilis TaxID=578943 RepID=A0A4R6WPW3_9PROT|nr:NADH-quinone oxidoreductase subunit NuoE [Dongia mobilis]TDQ80547.1 NADH dehydrogenase subunit E [Dongia mobilis]